jgi:hypothetical protein
MTTDTTAKAKTIEFVIWLIGALGILFVVVNQNTVAGTGPITKQYFPYILITGILLISASLILKIVRESKHKDFSIFRYSYQILRSLGAIGFAIYALVQ